jgi:phospholipase/carboxylesterase
VIAREKERGTPANRIVLAGFSQGCAMVLLTGLRHAERLAGIVGMSGYLPLADMTDRERTDANRLTPIFLAHGTMDPIVPLEASEMSRDALAALGYDVQWHSYPMPHSVCMEEIRDLNAWLLKVLA